MSPFVNQKFTLSQLAVVSGCYACHTALWHPSTGTSTTIVVGGSHVCLGYCLHLRVWRWNDPTIALDGAGRRWDCVLGVT